MTTTVVTTKQHMLRQLLLIALHETKSFSMRSWQHEEGEEVCQEHTCGTPACIGGHAAHILHTLYPGTYSVGEYNIYNFNIPKQVAEEFGFPREDVTKLFMPGGEGRDGGYYFRAKKDKPGYISQELAIETYRWLLNTGVVSYTKAARRLKDRARRASK